MTKKELIDKIDAINADMERLRENIQWCDDKCRHIEYQLNDLPTDESDIDNSDLEDESIKD